MRTMSGAIPRGGMNSIARTLPSSVSYTDSRISVSCRYRRVERRTSADGREQPASVVGLAEQRGEAGARVEPREAAPVDRPRPADERRRLQVAEQRVVLDPRHAAPSYGHTGDFSSRSSSCCNGEGSPRSRRRRPETYSEAITRDEHHDDRRRDDECRGDRTDDAHGDAGKRTGESLAADRAGHAKPKEHMADQVDRRPGDNGDELRRRQGLGGMQDHDLVADRGHDHPRHEDDVQVRVAVACERRPVGRELEAPLRDAGDVVEVEPPQGRGREERESEGGHAGQIERQRGRRAPVTTIDSPSAMMTKS